jgi:hypothetical protein
MPISNGCMGKFAAYIKEEILSLPWKASAGRKIMSDGLMRWWGTVPGSKTEDFC